MVRRKRRERVRYEKERLLDRERIRKSMKGIGTKKESKRKKEGK